MGDDQKWIREAREVAVATFGCQPFSKTLFHIPTGGSHDQETFNHEKFDRKCAGKPWPHCLPTFVTLLVDWNTTCQAVCVAGLLCASV